MMQVSLSSTTTVPITMLLNTTSNLVLFIYIQATFLIYLKIFLLFSFAFYLNNVPGFIDTLDACCGAGPTYPYGFQSQDFLCSNETEALYVCPNPVNFINWDGIHYTDSFNFQMFNHTFLTGSFMYPIDGLCRTRASQK